MSTVGLRSSVIKAKVSFAGTTGAILASQSYNVSSVSRSSLGSYTITFSNALDTANYAVVGTVSEYGSYDATRNQGAGTLTIGLQATGSVTIATAASGENISTSTGFDNRRSYDPAIVTVLIMAPSDETSPPTYSLRQQAIHSRISFSGSSPSLSNDSSYINVSSVTRTATGSYTVTYVSALSAADHCVAINSSCQPEAVGLYPAYSPSSPTPGCIETDVSFPTTTQARFYAKLAGNTFGSKTFYDPQTVEFLASATDTTAATVKLSDSTSRTWAYMSSTTLANSSNISSTTLVTTGRRRFQFINTYIDYTVVSSCAQQTTDFNSASASCTFRNKFPTSVELNTFRFGENVDAQVGEVTFNSTRSNIVVFGTINDFDVSLSATTLADTCYILTDGGGCTTGGPETEVTATPLGGTGPYTYQWSFIPDGSTQPGNFFITNPTSSTARFGCFASSPFLLRDVQRIGYFTVLVTDSAGKKGRSAVVTFISTHEDISGGEEPF